MKGIKVQFAYQKLIETWVESNFMAHRTQRRRSIFLAAAAAAAIATADMCMYTR